MADAVETVYVWFLCTYSMYSGYRNQTDTVASAAIVTGSDYRRRFRLFLGQCACELPRGVHGLKEKLLFMILIGCVRFILLS